jgi:uroporphyrinogen-III decarboxylase
VKPDLIVNETPEKMYTACRENIEMGKQSKSGFIFMGGCDIPATVPPYHIHLMSKAAQEFGQYN